MSARDNWQRTVEEELGALSRRAAAGELRPRGAWNARVAWSRLVQLARARGASAGAEPAWFASGPAPERPDAEGLLERLGDELAHDGLADGPLHDALLEVDGLASVDEVDGDRPRAAGFIQDAVDECALAPERVAPLGAWAEGRLETLPADSVLVPLWRAVADAWAAAVRAAAGSIPVRTGIAMERAWRQLVAASAEDVTAELRAFVGRAASERTRQTIVEHDRLSIYVEYDEVKAQFVVSGATLEDRVVLTLRGAAGEERRLEFKPRDVTSATLVAVLGTVDRLRTELEKGPASPVILISLERASDRPRS